MLSLLRVIRSLNLHQQAKVSFKVRLSTRNAISATSSETGSCSTCGKPTRLIRSKLPSCTSHYSVLAPIPDSQFQLLNTRGNPNRAQTVSSRTVTCVATEGPWALLSGITVMSQLPAPVLRRSPNAAGWRSWSLPEGQCPCSKLCKKSCTCARLHACTRTPSAFDLETGPVAPRGASPSLLPFGQM